MGEYKRTNEHKNSNTSGIYCITNLVNNKKYIGQTYNLNYRWRTHKNDLKAKRHHNKHLQYAWDKYGEDNFKFNILEYCSVDLLDERETYWIKFYDTVQKGYNLADGGLGCRGYKHTEDELHKMRQIQKPKAVLQLDKNLNVIAEYESSTHAMKVLDFPTRRVIECVCKRINHQKSYKGFIWVYKEEYDANIIPWEYYTKTFNYNAKKVNQYDLDMNFINTFESASMAGRVLNIHHSKISKVCQYKQKSTCGYIFRYATE